MNTDNFDRYGHYNTDQGEVLESFNLKIPLTAVLSVLSAADHIGEEFKVAME
jgi:hypothetical protein